MDSVRKGLRRGDITKDTYGRLECAACDVGLKQRSEPDELGVVRTCPECGREWRRLD